MYKGEMLNSCYLPSLAKGSAQADLFALPETMYDHQDPTAWQAIANVERERQQKPRGEPKKHSGVKHYGKLKETGGRVVHINKAEWFYSRMMKEINAYEGRVLPIEEVEAPTGEDPTP